MTKATLIFVGALVAASSAAASDSRFNFSCSEVKALVEHMEDGPTDVIDWAADDPVEYRDNSISGWVCVMTPLPPLKHGRPYLQSLDCYADNGDSHVTEGDLASAGELFKSNLNRFNACFRTDLLTEAPVSYTGGHRGEGIRAVLKSDYDGHHIVVQYGYLWDQVKTGRIVWQTIVGYAQ
jgi:hypothetical protein